MSIPAYLDIARLCEELCIGERTADVWVKQNLLPAPRLRGGKRLWKWKEVEQYLDGAAGLVPSSPDELATQITEATRHAIASKSR